MIAIFFILIFVGVIQGYSMLWEKQTKGKVKLSIRPERETMTDGEEVDVWLVVENTSWLPIPWLELVQTMPSELVVWDEGEWGQEIRYNTYLLPRQKVQRRFRVRMVRGLHRFEMAEVRFGDGVGLKDNFDELESLATMLVRPQLVEDQVFPLRLTELIGERSVLRWYQEDTSRLQGVHAYQLGDPYKQIHWAATARVGALMVKEFETTSETDFYVLLNHQFFDAFWMGTNRAVVNDTCRLAAGLLWQAAEQGCSYGLYTNASWAGRGGQSVPLAQGPMQFERVLDALGGILYRASGPFDELLHRMRTVITGRATVAIFTVMWNERIAVEVEHLRSVGHQILLLVDRQMTNELYGLSPAVTVIPLELQVEEAEWAEEAEVSE